MYTTYNRVNVGAVSIMHVFSQAKLLYAKYNDETLNVDMDGNISNYKEAIEVWRVWEKSLLSCARYYETVVDRMSVEARDTTGR